MERHLFTPLPDFMSSAQPADREERLKVVLANIEKQQQRVRANILNEAIKARIEASNSEPFADSPMDLDHDVAPPDHNAFAERLKAKIPDDSSDPCLPLGAIIASDQSITQAPTPHEVLIALEAIERLEAYDSHAKQVRNHYVQALKRVRSAKATQGAESGGISPFVDQRLRSSTRPSES